MININLIIWWNLTFLSEEKTHILKTYKPMGGEPLLVDLQRLQKDKVCSFLTNLSGWFSTIKDASIQGKILNKAIEFKNNSINILDVHFLYQTLIKYHYQQRNFNETFYRSAIEYCLKQISISSEAKKEFLGNQEFDILPRHVGFQQLSIIYEKEGRINEAIELCLSAENAGWKGDWEKRIQRLKKL